MRGIEAAFWGVLGKAPELKTSKTGKAFATMNIVVTVGEADNGKDVSQWLRVACFGETAERIAARAKKGDRVYCEGALTMTQWNDAAGEVRHGLNVAAWKCERVANIGRAREKKDRGETEAGSLPGTNGNRPSASYCAGPSAPRQMEGGFEEDRGDAMPF